MFVYVYVHQRSTLTERVSLIRMALHYKIPLYKSECRECDECTFEIFTRTRAKFGQVLSNKR